MPKRLLLQMLKKSFLPFFVILLISIAYAIYSTKLKLMLDADIDKYIQKASVIVFILSITFLFQRMCGAAFGWYRVNIAQKTQTTLDDEFIPLFRRVTNIFIWIIAVVIVLSKLGVNINALIATLGVSSLAIALAAQDTIANIISGFLIMIDRPFRIGDSIKLPSGEKVKVLDIGIRRSKFLSEENAIIIVPNLDLSKSKVVNFTYGEERNK